MSTALSTIADNRPSFTLATDSRRRRILIVALAGFGAESEEFFAPVADTPTSNGDVLYVNYGAVFDPRAIVADTIAKIKQLNEDITYRRIILIGVSMGGKLAWEIYRQLDPNVRRLLFIDTPLNKRDLPMMARFWAAVNSCLPRLKPFDTLATKMAFGGPKKHEMAHLTDEQREAIATSVENAHARNSVRRMAAQTRYLKKRNMVMKPGDKPKFMTVAFIESTRGTDVVKSTCYRSWCTFLDQRRIHHYRVDAKHAAFDMQRERYSEVLESALTALCTS